MKLRARVRTIPRTPDWPYMIVMVSTKTFSARDPDHNESRKPSEIRSARPPEKTSVTVGNSKSWMISGVRKRPAYCDICWVKLSIVTSPSHCPR